MNVIVPIAGAGRRFAEAGYTMPKPLVPVAGSPMLSWALECIPRTWGVYLIGQAATMASMDVFKRRCVQLTVAGPTQGAACTVLAAVVGLAPDEPVAVMNADQWFRPVQPLDILSAEAEAAQWDGYVLTFAADDPKWSYAETDATGMVTRIVEKQVVSQHATVGFYWFRRACDLLWACADVVARNDRTNGEFYLAPAYNHLIAAGGRVRAVAVSEMHGLGTPEDVAAFALWRAVTHA